MASSKKGQVTLRGRFSPGAKVSLVKVDGPHVLRPPDGASPEATATVDKDGCVTFPADIDSRYFIVGQEDGTPLAVRARGRADDDPNAVMTGGGVAPERVRLSDGSFLDEAPEPHQDTSLPEGATWLGQHQVPEGVVQRSDTPRGSAAIISAEELERAQRAHRKQEPTEPVVETEDADEAPARTAKPAAKHPAKTSKGAK